MKASRDPLAGGTVPPVRLDDFEPRARAVLSTSTYDYFAGGAEDEATVAGNRAAFGRYRFRFQVLAATPEPDLRCQLLGESFSMPVQLAPTATQKLAHPDGELAVARAAARAKVAFCLSTLSTVSIEDVAAAGAAGVRWFQLYIYRDRAVTRDLIERAAASGYTAVMLTVDTPTLGRRERDFRNGFDLAPGLRYENLRGALTVTAGADPGQSALSRYFTDQLDSWLSWKDLEWLVTNSRLPVMAKGIVRGDDAGRAVESGVRAVAVSNHGGRQLDYSVATLDALPEVVEAVASKVPVLLDGGVRRGTDVLKALCLGARSVMIGRPYLWGLATDGEAGVSKVLELLRHEILVSMSLLGVKSLAELNPDLLTER